MLRVNVLEMHPHQYLCKEHDYHICMIHSQGRWGGCEEDMSDSWTMGAMSRSVLGTNASQISSWLHDLTCIMCPVVRTETITRHGWDYILTEWHDPPTLEIEVNIGSRCFLECLKTFTLWHWGHVTQEVLSLTHPKDYCITSVDKYW